MKKTNSILASSMLAAAIAFLSCAPSTENTPADTIAPSASQGIVTTAPEETEKNASLTDGQVLLINNGQYGESGIEYIFDCEDMIMTVDENKVGTEKTVEFLGKQYGLVYNQTVTYVTHNATVDEYCLTGDMKLNRYGNENHIRLLPDDSVFSISLDPILKIDIAENESVEDIRADVEKALQNEIDFDKFEFCNVTEPNEEAGYDYYTLTWFNKKNDIPMSDTVRIYMLYDGDITTIWMNNKVDLGLNSVRGDFGIESYLPHIEKKLREIFKEAYVSYEIKSSIIGNIDGKPCIVCDISTVYNDGNGDDLHDLIEMAVFINQ